jgi:hypothetical protein
MPEKRRKYVTKKKRAHRAAGSQKGICGWFWRETVPEHAAGSTSKRARSEQIKTLKNHLRDERIRNLVHGTLAKMMWSHSSAGDQRK